MKVESITVVQPSCITCTSTLSTDLEVKRKQCWVCFHLKNAAQSEITSDLSNHGMPVGVIKDS